MFAAAASAIVYATHWGAKKSSKDFEFAKSHSRRLRSASRLVQRQVLSHTPHSSGASWRGPRRTIKILVCTSGLGNGHSGPIGNRVTRVTYPLNSV